jgi:2'-5'-oligoadenylate synthetase
MVVFLINLTSFEDQFNGQVVFIEEIWRHLLQLQQEKLCKLKFEVQSPKEPNSRFLSFKLSCPERQHELEFDVQPAYDALCKSTISRASVCPPLMHESSLLFLCVCVCVCWG